MRKEDKMKKANKIVATLLALGMVSTSMTSLAADDIKIFVDDKQLECPVNPIIENERTLVPMRAIFEALGAKVDWDAETRTVTATRGDDVMKITIDSNELFKNDESIALDVPAKIVDDSTLVPVRAVSESFDAKVSWNGETQSVIIVTDNQPTETVAPSEEPKSTEEPTSTEKPTKKSNISDEDLETLKGQKDIIRYQFEQQYLPNYVFENKSSMYKNMMDIQTFGDLMFDQWDKLVKTKVIEIQVDSKTEYNMSEIMKEYNDDLDAYYDDILADAELDAESMFTGATAVESDSGIRYGIIVFKDADSMVECKMLGVAATKDGKVRYFTAENDIMTTTSWFFCEVTDTKRIDIGVFDKADEATDLQVFTNYMASVVEKDNK